MRVVIPVLLSTLFIISCNKDKFNTTPSAKFDSVNTKVLDKGDALRFNLKVTDKEGDLDSVFILKFVRNCPISNDTIRQRFPEFPTGKNIDIDVEIGFAYRNNTLGLPGIYEPQCLNRNDSAVFRFVIQDKARNRSDTINSPEVVILKP